MNKIFLIFCLASFFNLYWSSELIDLKPNDPFVFIGECLAFYCSLSSLTYGNSSTLYITLRGQNISQDHYEIVNATTMKFNMCITDLNQSGAYFCKKFNQIDNQTELHYSGQIVRVEKALVPIPENSIQCIVMNWQFMNCTWSLGETYKDRKNIEVNLTFMILNRYKPEKCAKLLQTSCQWDQDNVDLKMSMTINLTVSHKRRPWEKMITTFDLPRHKTVKPAQVNLTGYPQFTNISCFKFTWKHNFHYRLNYNVTITSKSTERETYNLGSNQKYEICNLLPGEKYKIGIYARPKSYPGIWSDPLLLYFETNGTRPSQPPSINSINFLWQPYSGIRLFWQGLTRRQSGAEKVWYLIDVENQSTFAPSGQSVIKLPLREPSNKCWIFEIWAENYLGRSKNSSKIEICNGTSVPVSVEMVEMLMLNETFVEVMWTKRSTQKSPVSQFKVLACKNCSVDFQWWIFDANKSSVILQLDQPKDYMFSVAAENQNGSSGLIFGYCYYYRNKPQTPITGFSVQPMSDRLQVVWDSYNCMNEKAFIIEYRIKYCVARNHSLCNEGVKVSSVPRSQRNFETSKLSPNDYLVWMEPITYGGSGPSSIKQIVTITSSSLSTSEIVGIAIGSFLVFLLIIVGCKSIYDKCALQIAECDPKIEFPKIIQDKDSGIISPYSSSSSTSNPDISPTCSTQTDITQLSSNSHCNASICDGVVRDSDQHAYMKITIDNSDSLGKNTQSSTFSLEYTQKQNANNNAVTKDDYVDPNASDISFDHSGNNSHHMILDDNSSFSDSNSLGSLNVILGTGNGALAKKCVGVKNIQENINYGENEGINQDVSLTKRDIVENIANGKVIALNMKEQNVKNSSMTNFEKNAIGIDEKTGMKNSYPTEILKDNSMQVGVHYSDDKDTSENVGQSQKNPSAYVSIQNASDYVVVAEKDNDYIETSAFSNLSNQSGSSMCSHDSLLHDDDTFSSSFIFNDDKLNDSYRAGDTMDNNVSNIKASLPNLRNDSLKTNVCKNGEISQIFSPIETFSEKISLTEEPNKVSSKIEITNAINLKNNSSPCRETNTTKNDNVYIFVDDKQDSDAMFNLNEHCVKKAQAKQINVIGGNHSYELHELSQKV